MSQILSYKSLTPQVAKTAFVAPNATLAGDVKVGECSSIWFNAVIRGDIQRVEIGKYTNIQDNVSVHVTADEPTIIGDYVAIGHNAVVHCSKIGNNCLIGMGAVLLGYTEIGDNCIIGAGTLITQHKKIPPNSVVYGNPAQIIRPLRDNELEAMKKAAISYFDIAEHYLKK